MDMEAEETEMVSHENLVSPTLALVRAGVLPCNYSVLPSPGPLALSCFQRQDGFCFTGYFWNLANVMFLCF